MFINSFILDVNECLSNPCDAQRSLRCVDKINGYECLCFNGWNGTHCKNSKFVVHINVIFSWLNLSRP